MRKFIKLLDPWEITRNASASDVDPRATGRQQQRAREEFPALVGQSNLHYWRPGDEISRQGLRFLIALAAGFSIPDLRFADVINEHVSDRGDPPTRVDVFDIEDLSDWGDLVRYYPGSTLPHVTPVVGIWENGLHQLTLRGGAGRDYVLTALRIPLSGNDIVADLCPPDPKLMED